MAGKFVIFTLAALAAAPSLLAGSSSRAAAETARAPARLIYASIRSPGRFSDTPSPDNVADLFALGRDGKTRRITRTSVWEDDPEWSPDGRRIAFSKGQTFCNGGSCQGPMDAGIWVRSVPGSRVRRLSAPEADSGSDDQSPTWSPDGDTIAYARYPDAGINTVEAGGGISTLLSRRPAYAIDWSPEGSTIAFITDEGRVGLVDVDTGEARNIAVTNLPGRRDGELDLAWAPSAPKIAIATTRGIFIVSAAGGRARSVVKARACDGVTWSPDGRRLAYSARSTSGSRGCDIFVVGVDGRRLTRLRTGPGDNFSPNWHR